MDFRQEWIMARVASTIEDLKNAEGCHLDEAICLLNYLEGTVSAQSAAKEIVSAVLHEYNPPTRIHRVWSLLGNACEVLDGDLEKLLDLLAAIQKVGSTDQIDWWRLQGFMNVWDELHWSLDDMSWDINEQGLSKEEIGDLRSLYKSIGTAEARMFVRDIGEFNELRGYNALNLICSWSFGLEVFISRVHAWLEIAGPKLAATFQPDQVKCFTRGVKGRPEKKYEIEVTMAEHWEHWIRTFLQVSCDDDFLSAKARQLAAECYDMMKKQAINMPWSK